MSHTRRARSVLGLVAALAVAGAILVPPSASPAVAAPVPTSGATVGATGEIPCLDASEGEFKTLGCQAIMLDKRNVLSNSVVPIVTSARSRNCDSAPVNPAGSGTSIQASFSVGVTESVSSGMNGASMISHGTTVTVAPSYLGTSVGSWSYHYMNTQVTGWDWTTSNGLNTTYSTTEGRTEMIKPYHWSFWTFKPQYREIDLLWTWSEPSLTAERVGFRSSGIQTLRFPVFRDGIIPSDGDGDGTVAVASNTIMGELVHTQIPMTPAEADACGTDDGVESPSFIQPTQLAPSGTVSLSSTPFLYTVAPPVAPVLRNKAGTATRLLNPQLVIANTWSGGPVYDRPVARSLQLTGNSEAAFWTGGNCSTFTATVGYGTNLLLARDGYARDTIQVLSKKADDLSGEGTLLYETLVPAAPDLPEVAGPGYFQANLNVDVSGAEVLVLKVVTGPGYRDTMSDRTPGVLVAEPLITCGTGVSAAAFQQSAYVDPVREVTIDLAATPEGAAANPTEFMQPSEVNYGWGGCVNDPKNPAAVMPRTIVGEACGGAPLTVQGQVYDSGIGFHSGNAEGGPASVLWAKTPELCTTLSFGVAFDDHPFFPRATHKVEVYAQLHDTKDGTLDPWFEGRKQIGSTLSLSGDGTSGVQWFHFENLGVGAKRIGIEVTTTDNGGGHVDIISPTLKCTVQGPTVGTPTTIPSRESAGVYAISSLDWARESGFHGPVERDMSNGEQARGDGRPVQSTNGGPVMAIGGVSGWSSGIGMAPYFFGFEASVDVTTAGRCERLTSWVGIDDYAGTNGSVIFKVYADGKLVAQSPVKRGGQLPSFLSADVTGAYVVTIAANNADGSPEWDHADWVEPKLICSSSPRTAYTIPASNVPWIYEDNGWGPVERNTSLGEAAARDGVPMAIGYYGGWTSGIGMAPRSGGTAAAVMNVSNCSHFTVSVGMDDETTWYRKYGYAPDPRLEPYVLPHEIGYGSAKFYLYADGRLVASSPVMRTKDKPFFMSVDLTGVQNLHLVVDDAGDGNAYDHADWANPTLYCG